MNEEILVSGDMRISMLQEHAPRFGMYRKIARKMNDRVAYRHKNAKVDSCIWYQPMVGWLIGPRRNFGTTFAFLHGDMDSPTPVYPCRWKVLVAGTRWAWCDTITISNSTSLETNHGQSVNLGSSKEHFIPISEHEGNFKTQQTIVSDVREPATLPSIFRSDFLTVLRQDCQSTNDLSAKSLKRRCEVFNHKFNPCSGRISSVSGF